MLEPPPTRVQGNHRVESLWEKTTCRFDGSERIERGVGPGARPDVESKVQTTRKRSDPLSTEGCLNKRAANGNR